MSSFKYITLLTVQPLNVTSGRKGEEAEDGKIKLWCMSSTSNPAVIIVWKFTGNAITYDPITNEKQSNGDFHGTEVYSEVVIDAEQIKNDQNVICTPHWDGVLLEKLSREFPLKVPCMYYYWILASVSSL